MATLGGKGKGSLEEMAEAPKLLDADTLIDEILAKKGPHVYQDGLSEENWEEVSRAVHIL